MAGTVQSWSLSAFQHLVYNSISIVKEMEMGGGLIYINGPANEVWLVSILLRGYLIILKPQQDNKEELCWKSIIISWYSFNQLNIVKWYSKHEKQLMFRRLFIHLLKVDEELITKLSNAMLVINFNTETKSNTITITITYRNQTQWSLFIECISVWWSWLQ